MNIYWKIFTAQASISSVSPNRGFISPASNAADRTVTISGSFADMNLNAFTVYFGTMPAAVISSSNSQIVVSYPETTTPGAVDVKIAYTDSIHGFTDWVTNSVPFTYEDSYLRFDTTETEALSVLFSPSGAAPANGVFAVKSGRKVSTNNPNGYHLSLAPQDGGTDLVCAENNARTIPSVSAAGALDIGDYGYKVDSGDQNGVNSGWNPILADQVVKNVPEPVDGNPVNLWFGMRLDASVPACEAYERVFVMTLAANL
ncbi:MAG: IPT/TIG domain-containing protein [Oscillospiraceae bacterium]|nr:IPT/TIG domain-containing protein [Oscillospiraceae bacterium]